MIEFVSQSTKFQFYFGIHSVSTRHPVQLYAPFPDSYCGSGSLLKVIKQLRTISSEITPSKMLMHLSQDLVMFFTFFASCNIVRSEHLDSKISVPFVDSFWVLLICTDQPEEYRLATLALPGYTSFCLVFINHLCSHVLPLHLHSLLQATPALRHVQFRVWY